MRIYKFSPFFLFFAFHKKLFMIGQPLKYPKELGNPCGEIKISEIKVNFSGFPGSPCIWNFSLNGDYYLKKDDVEKNRFDSKYNIQSVHFWKSDIFDFEDENNGLELNRGRLQRGIWLIKTINKILVMQKIECQQIGDCKIYDWLSFAHQIDCISQRIDSSFVSYGWDSKFLRDFSICNNFFEQLDNNLDNVKMYFETDSNQPLIIYKNINGFPVSYDYTYDNPPFIECPQLLPIDDDFCGGDKYGVFCVSYIEEELSSSSQSSESLISSSSSISSLSESSSISSSSIESSSEESSSIQSSSSIESSSEESSSIQSSSSVESSSEESSSIQSSSSVESSSEESSSISSSSENPPTGSSSSELSLDSSFSISISEGDPSGHPGDDSSSSSSLVQYVIVCCRSYSGQSCTLGQSYDRDLIYCDYKNGYIIDSFAYKGEYLDGECYTRELSGNYYSIKYNILAGPFDTKQERSEYYSSHVSELSSMCGKREND